MQKPMNLSIMNEIFLNFRDTFDNVLNAAMEVNEKHELAGFKISINLDLSLPRVSVPDEFSPTNEQRTTIMPNISFKFGATLQQKFEAKGRLPNNFEIAYDPSINAIVFRKIDEGQTSLFNEDAGMKYQVDERGSVTIDGTWDSDDEQEN